MAIQRLLYAHLALDAGAGDGEHQIGGQSQQEQGHGLTDHIIAQGGGFNHRLGREHDKRQQWQPEVAHAGSFGLQLRFWNAEVGFGDATRTHDRQVDAEYQVTEGEVQGDLEHQLGAEQTAIGEQQAASQDEQAARQAMQHCVEERDRGVPLVVLTETAKVLGNLLLSFNQCRALPDQQAADQQQAGRRAGRSPATLRASVSSPVSVPSRRPVCRPGRAS